MKFWNPEKYILAISDKLFKLAIASIGNDNILYYQNQQSKLNRFWVTVYTDKITYFICLC